MANPYFRFKQFTVHQDRCAMKVTTDGCLFGAWCAAALGRSARVEGPSETLLDVGAGSGLLSLMVAQKASVAIEAVEIDADAAAQAAVNVTASPWRERITVVGADVLQWSPPHRHDWIMANPPFYEGELKSPNSNKNLAHHEAGLTLKALFSFIQKQLKGEGSFFLLLPAKRAHEAEERMNKNRFALCKKTLVRQTPNHSPFRVMLRGSRNETANTAEDIIVIKDNEGRYTPEFSALLKDYYLYL